MLHLMFWGWEANVHWQMLSLGHKIHEDLLIEAPVLFLFLLFFSGLHILYGDNEVWFSLLNSQLMNEFQSQDRICLWDEGKVLYRFSSRIFTFCTSPALYPNGSCCHLFQKFSCSCLKSWQMTFWEGLCLSLDYVFLFHWLFCTFIWAWLTFKMTCQVV